MSEWKEFILKNLLKEKGYIRGPFGSSLKRSEMKKEGTPVYEQEHAIYNNRIFRFFIDKEKTAELKRFLVKDNDLIISCSGTVGKVSIIKEDDPKGIISQALLLLRPNTEIIFPEYLHYFFKSKNGFNQLINASEGSVQPNISSRGIVESIPINIPPKEIQNKILTVLFSLDDKIDLLHRQNKTLEALAETLFRQWFIEEAEESWEEVKVKDVCRTITKGTTPTTLGYNFTKTGINFLKAESITDLGDLIENKFAFIDEETNNALNRSKIEANDVIITIAGTIGRVAIVTERFLPANTNQAVALLRVNKDSISPYFLYYLLRSRNVVIDFESRIVHAVQPNLSLGEIGDISFKMPEKNKLKNGESVLKQLFDKKEKNNVQIRTLTQLRDTLLPKLMSGEVRVEG